jgi:hypothetical protein
VIANIATFTIFLKEITFFVSEMGKYKNKYLSRNLQEAICGLH